MGADPNSVDMRAWIAEMRSLTMAQIDTGLKACRQDPSEWPPSPGMFKARCLGVPRYARARYEIGGKGEHRSPFVRKMWEFVDASAYRQAPADKADRMLRDAYDLTIEHVLADGDMPDAPVALIEQQDAPKPSIPTDPAAKAEILRRAREEAGIREAAEREYAEALPGQILSDEAAKIQTEKALHWIAVEKASAASDLESLSGTVMCSETFSMSVGLAKSPEAVQAELPRATWAPATPLEVGDVFRHVGMDTRCVIAAKQPNPILQELTFTQSDMGERLVDKILETHDYATKNPDNVCMVLPKSPVDEHIGNLKTLYNPTAEDVG